MANTVLTASPTMEKFMAMRKDKHLISMAESVVMAMAIYQQTAETVTAYQAKILLQGQWRVDPEFTKYGIKDEVITDPKNTFALTKENAAEFFALCEVERSKARLSISKPGNCPMLEAETTLRQAEMMLMECAATYTSIDPARVIGIKNREKLLDIILKTVAPDLDPHRRFGIPKFH